MVHLIRLLSLLILLFVAACDNQENPEYIESIETWRQVRLDSLKGKTGYVNLAGLFWLEEGENMFGSGSINKMVFPEVAPQFMGSLILHDGNVLLQSDLDLGLSPGTDLVYEDSTRTAVAMTSGSLMWYVITRGEKTGVRLRDYKNPSIAALVSIESYPIRENWKIEARYEEYDQPKTVDILNINGQTSSVNVKGGLFFKFKGKEYELWPTDDSDGDWFVTFSDPTSEDETYGAGRYIHVDFADENGKTTIDFNKAYNPPCAFTEFATCPFPPDQNILPFKILAGEKFSAEY